MKTETSPAPSANDRGKAFIQYLEHLTNYHAAMIMGDAEAARLAREELYEPLEELSNEEIDWLDEVSGDLYMLHGTEVFQPSSQTHQELIGELQAAQARNDGEAMLKVLRQIHLGPKALRAHFRANAYSVLGYPRLTLMFRAYANAHVSEPDYSVLLLNDLWRFRAEGLAREYALLLLEVGSARARLFSAMILYSSVSNLPTEEARPFMERCIASLEGISSSTESQGFNGRERKSLLLSLASCYAAVKDTAKARQAYDNLLSIAPNDPHFLELRGRLLLSVDPTAAVDDFKAAIKRHTKSALPYLILAKNALIAQKYPMGRRFSKAAYALAQNDRARAQAMEFVAICDYELGRSIDTVLDKFAQALKLDPENQTYIQNRDAIKRDAEKKLRPEEAHLDVNVSRQSTDDTLASMVEEQRLSPAIIDYIDSMPRDWENNKDRLDQRMQQKYATAV